MAFNLQSEKVKVRYSPSEVRLFGILSNNKRKRMAVGDLIQAFYPRGSVPFHGRTIVNGIVNSLIRKTHHNREDFRMKRSPQRGPHQTEVWLERS